MTLPFIEKPEPDHAVVDDKSKLPPHPFMIPHWGDVDNERSIHLFTEPSENYVPTVGSDVMFKDHDEVSFYLINSIHIFTN